MALAPKTQVEYDHIVSWANDGHTVYPYMFQNVNGSNRSSVAAAIRAAIRDGKIVQDGVDGVGKPKYVAYVMPDNVIVGQSNVNSPWYQKG